MKAPVAATLIGTSLFAGFAAGFAVSVLYKPTERREGSAASVSDSFFIAKEKEVWEALKRKDRRADSQLLAEDFVGLYDTGFATRSDHLKQMDDSYAIDSYTIQDTKILRLSPKTVLLLYRSTCNGSGTWEQYCSRPVYVSSLWVARDGHWFDLFSQDTLAANAP